MISNPDWSDVLAAADAVSHALPNAVLTGGAACGLVGKHRASTNLDFIVEAGRGDALREARHALEANPIWHNARVSPKKAASQIYGCMAGIGVNISRLASNDRLPDTVSIEQSGFVLNVASPNSLIRLKGRHLLERNLTRDYLDFAALTFMWGAQALFEPAEDWSDFELQDLAPRLSSPWPEDRREFVLKDYRQVEPRWRDWEAIRSICRDVAGLIDRSDGASPAPATPVRGSME